MSPAPWNSEPVMGYRNDSESAGEIERDFKSIPMRPSPIVHPAVDAPICPECQGCRIDHPRKANFWTHSALRKF